MESIETENFRRRTYTRIAHCLAGEFERGRHVAKYQIPKLLAGINLAVDCDLLLLAKHVEFDLNEALCRHPKRALRTNYKVSVNTLNGICHFTAVMLRA